MIQMEGSERVETAHRKGRNLSSQPRRLRRLSHSSPDLGPSA